MGMAFRYALLLIIAPALFLQLRCKDSGTEASPAELIVRLENQTDHSGIMIRLVELNKFVITDSLGRFEFDSFAPGTYTLRARYPYFKTEERTVLFEAGKIKTQVNIVLKQQLQFWIEPAETTISRGNLNNPNFFSFSGMRLHIVNISGEPVNVGTYLDPLYPWGIMPQGFDWPFVPNPDNHTEYCYAHYGWLGSTDAIVNFRFWIQPGDTLLVIVPRHLTVIERDCVREGTYLFYSLLNNHGHYPEYFDPSYFMVDTLPHPQPYNQLTKTFLKKRQLFRPVIVNITN